MPEALYNPVGNRFEPSPSIRGPWSFDHCHGGPPAGLLTTILCSQRPDMRPTRVTCEIPGPIPLVPVRVTTSVVRPGRRITLQRAEMTSLDGTVLMTASAWFMRTDESIVGMSERDDRPVPPPDQSEPVLLEFWGDEPDFSSAVDLRAAEGRPFTGTGPATMWVSVEAPLLPGEPWNPYAHALAAADFPNGVSSIEPIDALVAINTDVTVYFGREPVGKWLAVRSQTNSSGLGLGMTDSLLYDASGFVGTANQSIFFDRVPPPGTNVDS